MLLQDFIRFLKKNKTFNLSVFTSVEKDVVKKDSKFTFFGNDIIESTNITDELTVNNTDDELELPKLKNYTPKQLNAIAEKIIYVKNDITEENSFIGSVCFLFKGYKEMVYLKLAVTKETEIKTGRLLPF